MVHHTNGGYNQMAICLLVAMQGGLDMEGGLTVGGGLPFDLFASTAQFNREDLYEEIKGNRFDLEDFPIWTKYVKQVQTNRWPEYAADGKIKMMMMWGGNALMWPQSPLYQEAIGSLEFAAAADYFYRPWTHNFCDIILPAAMCMERMAPLSIFGRKIYLREPVVEPLGEAREDWRSAMELGCRPGLREGVLRRRRRGLHRGGAGHLGLRRDPGRPARAPRGRRGAPDRRNAVQEVRDRWHPQGRPAWLQHAERQGRVRLRGPARGRF